MKFSLITCSNDLACYTRNVAASTAAWGPQFERVLVDNRDNRFTLPEALNHGRRQARGDILIFCHQDVIFPTDWLRAVESQIALVESIDPQWGVIGLMGVKANGQFAGHIQDPHTSDRLGRLPCEVATLDEVCLIIRSDLVLLFDEDLGGHHFYGADLCLAVRQEGLKCYAIDAPLRHLSGGRLSEEFFGVAARLKTKWSNIPRSPLAIETTCGAFPLRDTLPARLAAALKTIRRRARRRLRHWRHARPA